MPKVKGLSPKQKRFVKEYLVDLNLTAAAIRAGYSEKTASQSGYQLFHRADVQAAIQEERTARAQRTEISGDKVIEELAKVAFSKAADFPNATLKYANKVRALELLGKHMALFDGKGADPDGGVQIVDDV